MCHDVAPRHRLGVEPARSEAVRTAAIGGLTAGAALGRLLGADLCAYLSGIRGVNHAFGSPIEKTKPVVCWLLAFRVRVPAAIPVSGVELIIVTGLKRVRYCDRLTKRLVIRVRFYGNPIENARRAATYRQPLYLERMQPRREKEVAVAEYPPAFLLWGNAVHQKNVRKHRMQLGNLVCRQLRARSHGIGDVILETRVSTFRAALSR